MPKWGEAGRLVEGSTKDVLKLDKPVSFDGDAATHKVLVHQSAVLRGQGAIVALAGDTIQLDLSVTERIRRVRLGEIDRQIIDVAEVGNLLELVLQDATGLAVGDVVELWDTDVIEERYAEPLDEFNSSEVTELRLTSPLTTWPAVDANWMFGHNEQVAKPFRIIAMSGDGDYTRSLTLVEYNETIYDDPQNAEAAPNVSLLSTEVSPVEELTVTESLRVMNNQLRTFVQVSWKIPDDGQYAGARIYVRENSGPWAVVQEGESGVSVHEFEAVDGAHLDVRVRAIQAGGAIQAWEKAPEASIDVLGKTAPPAMPGNFRVERTRTGIHLSWDAVEELDLRGYEVRWGLSWEEGEVIVSEIRSTSVDTLKVAAGENNYFLRAVDTGGRYSEIATATITVAGPGEVRNFIARRSLSHIFFLWDAVEDENVVGYEIREGMTWGASVPIAKTDATTLSIPHDTSGPRSFWIKAYDSLGLYGPGALAIATVPFDQGRNIVLETDEKAKGWLGFKLHTAPLGDGLALNAGRTRGEYVFEVEQAIRLASRVVSYAAIDAVLSSDTWAQATYTWSDSQAKQPWERDGDVESVSAHAEIATDLETLPTELVEAFRFNDTTTGMVGAGAATFIGTTYAPARFANGIRLTPFSSGAVSVTVPSEFSVRFWLRLTRKDATMRVAELSDGAAWMRIKYRHVSSTFVMECSYGVTLETGALSFAVDAPLLVVIVQTASERRLIVGDGETLAFVEAGAAATPLVSFDTIDFAL